MPEFDVIVVGAGLAGSTAAIVAARLGLRVGLIERGRRPGSKNVIGGILYSQVLDRLIPEFSSVAPIERHVISRSFAVLTGDSQFSIGVRSEKYNAPPDFNRSYTIRRTQFDPWLVGRAREAGATVVSSTVVEGLLHEDHDPAKPVIGVLCGREGGELGAKIVILAEGANALIAESEHLRPKTAPNQVMLGVKEVLQLDRDRLEDRFGLEPGAGAALEYFGEPAAGGFGSGFIYTNHDSLSVGLSVSLAHLAKLRLTPYELLDRFKLHPCLRPLLGGTEPLEYCSHLLPVGTYRDLPEMIRDGLILTGDAARLANISHYKELTNLVTASGVAAGKIAAQAIRKGDTSREYLKAYLGELESGFVMKDIRKFTGLAETVERNPELLKKYPKLFVEIVTEHFTISEKPKQEVETELMRKWNRSVSPKELRKTVVELLEAVGFSLAPLMRKLMVSAMTPGRGWLGVLRQLLGLGRRDE